MGFRLIRHRPDSRLTMLALLEKIDLHVAQRLLQLCHLFFTLRDLPRHLVLRPAESTQRKSATRSGATELAQATTTGSKPHDTHPIVEDVLQLV